MTKSCQICNTEYKFCPDCDRVNSYRKVVDNPVCYKIYMVLYELRMNIIDEGKAKEELNAIGVNNDTLEAFKLLPAVQKRIATIVANNEEIEVKTEEQIIKKSKRK